MAKRKVYTDEFKQETVQYIVDHPDMTMYAISKELGVSQTSLNSWSKQFNKKIENHNRHLQRSLKKVTKRHNEQIVRKRQRSNQK